MSFKSSYTNVDHGNPAATRLLGLAAGAAAKRRSPGGGVKPPSSCRPVSEREVGPAYVWGNCVARVLVRLGYNALELGVVISEGPKTFTVLPLYGLTLEQAIEDAPNRKYGERWAKGPRLHVLDTEKDAFTIEQVKALIRAGRETRNEADRIEREFRQMYETRIKTIFPGAPR